MSRARHRRRLPRLRLLAVFDGLAGGALVAMLAVTAAGILTRLLFDLSGGALDLLIGDAVEVATYALLVTVFAALPRALADGLVRVELFSRAWPAWLQGALDRLWDLSFALLAGLLAWRYARETLAVLARGETTQDMQLPLWPFYLFAALAFAGVGLIALAKLRRWAAPRRRAGPSRRAEPPDAAR